jgi:hypothetical protein
MREDLFNWSWSVGNFVREERISLGEEFWVSSTMKNEVVKGGRESSLVE